jgi:hypothetical protein
LFFCWSFLGFSLVFMSFPLIFICLSLLFICHWIHFFGFLWYKTAMHQTTVLSYKMHRLCRKGHAMFSQSRVFSSIIVSKTQQTEK